MFFNNRKPCDVVWRFIEDGSKVRVSKRTGRVIPIPDDAYATIDYIQKSNYKRNFFFNKILFYLIFFL